MLSVIADIRKDYKLKSLSEEDVTADPIQQFSVWWNEAVSSEVIEVNAMTLATATKEGIPSARIVLLKGFNEDGFMFFTNYESHKGRELAENPHAALVFFWPELERQIRIEGKVEKVAESVSDDYYLSRPAGSRIGAWASPQSTVIESRKIIEQNVLKYEKQFSDGNISRPPYWGGFIVKPVKIEFWQGRSSRLHDRIQYTKADETWKIERLAP